VNLAVARNSSSAQKVAEILNLDTAWEYDWLDEIHLRALRAGDTFIEFMSPIHPTVPLGKYLDACGEGPYLVVAQAARDRDEFVQELLQRRTVLSGIWEDEQYRLLWLYPPALEGVLLEIGEVVSETNPWTGGSGQAREDWFLTGPTGDVRQLREIVVVVRNLERSVRRWIDLFGVHSVWRETSASVVREVLSIGHGTYVEFREPIAADSAEGQALSERGQGVFAVVLEASDLDAIDRRVGLDGSRRPLTAEYPLHEGIGIDPSAMAGVRFDIVRSVDGCEEWCGVAQEGDE
jgi:hypothetical protein